MNTEERKHKLLGLFEEFYADSRMVREKYARNRRLLADQALGRAGSGNHPRTGTPVLYATYRQELADAVELMPEAVFLPRRKEDEGRAKALTALHRAVLERMAFERSYETICAQRAQYGMGVCEIAVENGEVQVHPWDPRGLFIDPVTEEMQEGRAVFKVSYHTMDYFVDRYPKAARRMRPESPACLHMDDGKRIALITAYYKERDKGATRVHRMKIAGGTVLEDSRSAQPEGLFAHGDYPFVLWYYDRLPGTPWGFGTFDYLAPLQHYIDKLDTLVMRNLARSAQPRLMVNRAAGLDVNALLDEDKQVVLADRIDEDAIRWQESAPLAPYAVQMLAAKCDMLKTESGLNAASRGEMTDSGASGVAISMLQAAGSKRTNLHQNTINQAFLRMVRQIVSDLAAYGSRDASYRTEDGYAVLSDGDALGAWEYDLQVRLQRMPKYESVYQNQLLMQLVQMGTLPAGAAFELMDLSNKEAIVAAIRNTEGGEKPNGRENDGGNGSAGEVPA